MKKILKLLAVALVGLLAAPLAAEEGDDQPLKLPPQAKVIDSSVQKLGLQEDQKGKYQQIFQQYAPVLQKQYEQQMQIYTPEQKTKRHEASVKAKEQKLKGKEYEQFVQSAVQFTPEQQKQYVDCETEIMKTQSKYREEVYQILTPEQQEKFPKFGKDKGKGKEGKQQQNQNAPKQNAPKEQPQ